MDARGWLLRASLALPLVLIPLNFSDFTVNAADFVKTDSAHGTTMWVDREVKDFTLNPGWKIVQVKIRLSNGVESFQKYLIDFAHNQSCLIEADKRLIPIEEWEWKPVVPPEKRQNEQ